MAITSTSRRRGGRLAVHVRRRRDAAEAPSRRRSRALGTRIACLVASVLASSLALAGPAASHPSNNHANDEGYPPHNDLSCAELNALPGRPTNTFIVDRHFDDDADRFVRGVRFKWSDSDDSSVGPGANNRYGPGEKVRIEVSFNRHVGFDTRDDLWPRIQQVIDGGNVTLGDGEVLPTGLEPLSVLFMMDGQMRRAVSVPAQGEDATILVFEYEVPSGSLNVSPGDLFIPPNSLVANDNSQNERKDFPAQLKGLVNVALQSISGPCGGARVEHPPVFHPNQPGSPTIVSKPKILSEPANGHTYYLGEEIVLRVEFSEAVRVTGTPLLTFNLGGSTRQARYDAATSSETRLRFNYTVAANDTTDTDGDGMDVDADGENPEGVSVSRGSLSGGTIRADAANGRLATLNHYGLDAQVEFQARVGGDPTVSKHLVNGVVDTTDYEVFASPAHVFSYSTRIVSEPANGDRYYTAEEIIVRVDFSEAVTVAPGDVPSLSIEFCCENFRGETIAKNTVQADYFEGSGTTRLRFKYEIKTGDADADGVVVPRGNFDTTNGTIAPADADDGGSIYLHFSDVFEKPQPMHKIDGINVPGDPEVDGLPRIVSDPNNDGRDGDDDTYKSGDVIEVGIRFTQGVTVNVAGDGPKLTLRVGSNDRDAFYVRGDGTSEVVFAYTVIDGEEDGGGVSVPAGTIDENGGSIVAFDDMEPAGLSYRTLTDQSEHKVDAIEPTLSSFYIASDPPNNGDTYGAGQIIQIAAVFDEPVTASSRAKVVLNLDDNATETAYLPTDHDDTIANSTVIFDYEVQSGDLDTDGVSLADDALSGTFADVAGNETSSFADDDTLEDLDDDINHKVDTVSPQIVTNGVEVTSTPPGGDGVFRRGEIVTVTVTFDEVVYVDRTNGTPAVEIGPGSDTEYATYSSGHGTETLTFTYAVEADDHDGSNGAVTLSIGSDKVYANDKTTYDSQNNVNITYGLITDKPGNRANLNHSSPQIPTDRDEVNGSLEPLGPHVTGIEVISNPGADEYYKAGDTIRVRLTFSDGITATGSPQLALGIDTTTGTGIASLSSRASTQLTFSYQVSATTEDEDRDGISIAGNALTLNGGTIVQTSDRTMNAVLGLTAQNNLSGHKVDAISPTVTSAPRFTTFPTTDNTWAAGQEINLEVDFSEAVVVTSGTPYVPLTIGSRTRNAQWVEPSGYDPTDPTFAQNYLEFSYTVQAGDSDIDGVSIAADGLRGTIKDFAGNTASLDHDAVEDDAQRKVDTAAPSTTSLTVVSDPNDDDRTGDDDTYAIDDFIEIEVTFSEEVSVDSSVADADTAALLVQIGTNARSAAYHSQPDNSTLRFRYEVGSVEDSDDLDTNGISVSANRLTLPTGFLTDAHGNDASTAHPSLGTQTGHKVDGVRPTATRFQITSTPPNGGTHYGEGETIVVRVTFSEDVVPSRPRLQLDVGGSQDTAHYVAPDGALVDQAFRTLDFHFVVGSGDTTATSDASDTEGVAVADDPLVASSIQDAVGNDAAVDDDDTDPELAPQSPHQVETTKPNVTAATVTSDPPSGDGIYRLGEIIRVSVTFDEDVYVDTTNGTPTLALNLGDAEYEGGHGTDTLYFDYAVQGNGPASGGSDDSGSIAINGPVTLNSGEITDRAGNDANLGLNSITQTSDTVDGSQFPIGPHVPDTDDHTNGTTDGSPDGFPDAIRITSDPGADNTYKAGDTITIEIAFSDPITVSGGSPTLTLVIGIEQRTATYRGKVGSSTMRFDYQVSTDDTDPDTDTDGIEIATDALDFAGATVRQTSDSTKFAVALLPSVPTFTEHRVDGIRPSISSVVINSQPASDNTYGIGQTVEVDVAFDQLVVITGTPRIGLTIGTATKQAEYVENPHDIQNFDAADGVYTVRFEYTISSGDTDADGIGISANALRNTSGSTIKDLVGNPANLEHDAVEDAAVNPFHKVNTSAPSIQSVEVTSDSGLHGTYGPSSHYDTIEITVTFDELLEVTGSSSTLTIQVGPGQSGERTADFSHNTGSEAVYEYTVVADDLDSDGISIGANALSLNGDTIEDRTNNAADISRTTLGTQAMHKVDGVSPTATGVTIESTPPNGGDHYGVDQVIQLLVTFNEDLATPTAASQITLVVGTQEVTAENPAGVASQLGARGLLFSYTVEANLTDTDGIDVKADSLSGNFTDFAENQAAATNPTIAGDRSRHMVETDAPDITQAEISSTAPGGDGLYRLGEIITVSVTYDEVVYVTTGDPSMNDTGPQMDLVVGTSATQATYTSGSGTSEIVFAYEVVAADRDNNGIDFNSGSISLGGGTITDRAGNDAGLSYTGQGQEADHKVDGSQEPLGPTVMGAPHITSEPEDGGTYYRTETIEVTLTWRNEVTVTGRPQLEIRVGDAIKKAVYSGGSTTNELKFRYSVKSGDTDGNGVSVVVNSLELNGGTITGTSDSKIALLGHLGLPDAGGHRVDGSRLPVPYITGVAITSYPETDSGEPVYGVDDVIEIEVAWSEDVDVAGAPQIAILIGSTTRQARFITGSGTDVLTFRYTVRNGDNDSNGISLPGSRLTGGTIQDEDDDNASRAYEALDDDPNQLVDTSQSRVTDIRVTSDPRTGDTYKQDEIITFEVEFDEPVSIDPVPKLGIQVGASDRWANCVETPSDENSIECTYTVQPGDSDTNGVSVRRGSIDRREGEVMDTAGNPVNGTHSGLRNQADHKVDGGDADVRLRRIWGADRFETAAEIAEEYQDETADQGSTRGVIDTVIITSGRAFPDALSAAALAGSQRAPILLTEPNSLSKPVSDFIKSHSISRVYIVGGTAAVAQRVENSIEDLTSVRQVIRLGGRDRYETSVLVSQAVGGAGTLCGTTRRTVLLATGEDFADALSFAPIAAIGPHPLLLTERDSLPANVRRYLIDGHEDGFIDRVLVAGGTAAISNDVTAELTTLGLIPLRIGGRDRYDTAVRLAEYALGVGTPGEGTCLDNDQVGLAVAWNFADGLAAGPLLALVRGPTILLPTDPPVPSMVRRFLSGPELDREMLTLIALGGPAALSDEVLDEARDEASRAN